MAQTWLLRHNTLMHMWKRGVQRRGIWVWLPIVSLLLVDLIYQVFISVRQWDVIYTAQAWFLALAVVNQMGVYVVLVPAMQEFYAAANIILPGRRAFAMLAMGLAFSRIVPAGEYAVWRASMRNEKGGATATTQWLILYYSFMFTALLLLFLVGQVLMMVVFPNAHVKTIVGYLRFLPLVFILAGTVVALFTRFERVRTILRRLAYDRVGSQAVSPLHIIRDRRLGHRVLGVFAFAGVATWIIEGFTLYLCLRSLGQEVPLVMALFAFTFARLFTMIPLLPGGAGQIEAGAALLLVAYNYPFELVFTATLLYRLVTYWPPLLLGVGTYSLSAGSERAGLMRAPLFARQMHHRGGRAA